MKIIITLAILMSMTAATVAEAGILGVIDRIITHERRMERREAIHDYHAHRRAANYYHRAHKPKVVVKHHNKHVVHVHKHKPAPQAHVKNYYR